MTTDPQNDIVNVARSRVGQHGYTTGEWSSTVEKLCAEVERLRAELSDAAETIGAQTFDVKALGKARRATLVRLVGRLLRLADGEPLPPRPRVIVKTTSQIRERFEDVLDDR